jgi:hypothetical protein
MKRRLFTIAGVLAVGLSLMVLGGCASFATPALFGPGNYYSDTATVAAKRGEATGRVWIAVFGTESYPPVERVAKDNGITKIATVEHYSKLGILALWTDYTTIVTGE